LTGCILCLLMLIAFVAVTYRHKLFSIKAVLDWLMSKNGNGRAAPHDDVKVPIVNGAADETSVDASREIDRHALIIGSQLIKEGSFSRIYSGQYRAERVAVKILHEEQIRSFNQEKQIYLSPFFEHRNLLKYV
jgi:hypothetical protein